MAEKCILAFENFAYIIIKYYKPNRVKKFLKKVNRFGAEKKKKKKMG